MSETRKGSPSGDQITHECVPRGACRPGAQSSFPRAQLSLPVTAWRSQGRRQELDRQDRRGRQPGRAGQTGSRLIPTPQPRRIKSACDCRSSGVLGPGAPGVGAGGVSERSGDPRWETLSSPSAQRRGAARPWAAPRGPPRRPLTCQAGGPRVGPASTRETQAGFSWSPAQPDPAPPRLPAISRLPSGLRGEIHVSGRTQGWAPRARRPGPGCAARTPAREAEATGSRAPPSAPGSPRRPCARGQAGRGQGRGGRAPERQGAGAGRGRGPRRACSHALVTCARGPACRRPG